MAQDKLAKSNLNKIRHRTSRAIHWRNPRFKQATLCGKVTSSWLWSNIVNEPELEVTCLRCIEQRQKIMKLRRNA